MESQGRGPALPSHLRGTWRGSEGPFSIKLHPVLPFPLGENGIEKNPNKPSSRCHRFQTEFGDARFLISIATLSYVLLCKTGDLTVAQLSSSSGSSFLMAAAGDYVAPY